jgi:phage terminase small subunit
VKLTLKQKAFADYYIQFGNATEAAIKAGYSENYANAQSYKMLENVGIKNYIDERLKEIEDSRIADAKEVMQRLTHAARGELEEEVVVVEGTGDGCSDARIVNKKIGAKEQIKALELLGKRYKLFTDRLEIEGSLGVQIFDDIEADLDE